MARLEESLPTPSNTPSILKPINYIPTRVDPYDTPTANTINRCGISPRIEGRVLALIGAFITGLNLTGVKYLYGDNFPAPLALMTRYTPPLIFVLIIGFYMKLRINSSESQNIEKWYFFARDKNAFNILSIRAFFHWCCNLCMVYSLLFVPVMITISLFYLWTIFAIILSHFVLNEKANLGDIVLSIIGFAGVIMITDPTFVSFDSLGSAHIEGIILIIISALFYSVNMVILRKKRTSYHWTQTEAVAGLWSTFIFTPIYILVMYFGFGVPLAELIVFQLSSIEWVLFVAISVFAFIAIGGVTRALQLETIIVVSVILYSEVAFGTLFQAVFLHDTTNFNTFGLWIGILAVMISTFCIMYRKNKQQKMDEERKEFGSIDLNQEMHLNEENKLKSYTMHGQRDKESGNRKKIMSPLSPMSPLCVIRDDPSDESKAERSNLLNHVTSNQIECYGSVDNGNLV